MIRHNANNALWFLSFGLVFSSSPPPARAQQATEPPSLLRRKITPPILRAFTSEVEIELVYSYPKDFLNMFLDPLPADHDAIHRNRIIVRLNGIPAAEVTKDYEIHRDILQFAPHHQDSLLFPTATLWEPEPNQAGIVEVCVSFDVIDKNAAGAEAIYFTQTLPECFDVTPTGGITFDPVAPAADLQLTFPIHTGLPPFETLAAGGCDAVPPFAFTTDGEEEALIQSPFPLQPPELLADGGANIFIGGTLPPLPPPFQRAQAKRFRAAEITSNFNYPIITGSASDSDSGLGSISLTINGDDVTAYVTQTGGAHSRTFELKPFELGIALSPGEENFVELTVVDKAGNVTRRSTALEIDRRAPEFLEVDPGENELLRLDDPDELVRIDLHYEDDYLGIDPTNPMSVRAYFVKSAKNLKTLASSFAITSTRAMFELPAQVILDEGVPPTEPSRSSRSRATCSGTKTASATPSSRPKYLNASRT